VTFEMTLVMKERQMDTDVRIASLIGTCRLNVSATPATSCPW